MERRFLLAVSLMIAVLVVPSFFAKRRPPVLPTADSSVAAASPETGARGTGASVVRGAVAAETGAPTAKTPPKVTAVVADTIALALGGVTYRFSSIGGALDQAVFSDIKSFRKGDQKRPANLVRPGDRMLVHRLIVGSDTLKMDDVVFAQARDGDAITMTGTIGAVAQTTRIAPVPGRPFLIDVSGELAGLEGRGALLVIGMGTGFANVEADSMDNYRNYAVAVRRASVENTNFRSVDSSVVLTLPGPFDWIAVKSKYFMGALLSADSSKPQFGGAVLVGGPREGRLATTMQTWATTAVSQDGRFHYQLYLGPQQRGLLHTLGRDLDRASSYGWIFKPIVMPVAGLLTRFFLFMHEKLHFSYGFALVFFGVLVRLVLWPLNQKAMKSQVAMMAVQPIVKEIQTRYKNDPAKAQSEMMKIYKEHNVNPLGGCLPLLLPMPVLLALFFVFSRAIELRGTAFLWLPDLSLRDPLFITPLVMGASMFALSKMSQAGMPPNPQAKMMTNVMPVMMTVMFLNFASGLNLYYAVSNLVSLPQQYLINKARQAEMSRRQVSLGTVEKKT
jgi:YidC/Oxa1 family membrane protein insertase